MGKSYDPFSWILWMGFAGYWLMLGAVVVGGFVISLRAARSKRWPMLALGIVLILSPALRFYLGVANADHKFATRKAEIATMRRHPLPADYPRALLIEGNLAPASASALMVAGHFDQIVTRDFGFVDGFVNPVRDAHCLEAANQLLTPADEIPADEISDYRTELPEILGILEACVTKLKKSDAINLLNSDAVIMRLGTKATLRGRGEIWSQGIVEIQLKRRGREQLVDYRENPLVQRPASIWSPLHEEIDQGPALDAEAILLEALNAAHRK